ncbi:MAG TPA: methyltransferase, partial [Anaeromyxobacteraceae bacterium]|nr:methyltransferase [Anaeromyxobacteraceae bacterium]
MSGSAPLVSAEARALAAISALAAEAQLDAALTRLRGGAGPLAALAVGDERDPAPDLLDGRVLEAICQRALGGARGAVFTRRTEATFLAAHGLAYAAVARDRRVDAASSVAALLGLATPAPALRAALEGLRVLDFACGGGALLAAAAILAGRVGARLRLFGLDVSPLAARASAARLALLGAPAEVRAADALAARWPRADLILANPPFVRHELLSPAAKALAVKASGLSRQADLSAHLVALALRRADVVALVVPRALDTSRSAAPLRRDAAARGAWALRLRSASGGSFAASVDTLLAVWVAGAIAGREAEATVPLESLAPAELAALARGVSTPRLEVFVARGGAAPSSGVRVSDVADV